MCVYIDSIWQRGARPWNISWLLTVTSVVFAWTTCRELTSKFLRISEIPESKRKKYEYDKYSRNM